MSWQFASSPPPLVLLLLNWTAFVTSWDCLGYGLAALGDDGSWVGLHVDKCAEFCMVAVYFKAQDGMKMKVEEAIWMH
jgi:hypothetical protein